VAVECLCEVETWNDFRFSVSFLQLYLGRAQDLLEKHREHDGGRDRDRDRDLGKDLKGEGDGWGGGGVRQGGARGAGGASDSSSGTLQDLEVRDGPGGSWVRGLGEYPCSDVSSVLSLLSEGAR